MKKVGILGAGRQASETAHYLIEDGYEIEFFFTEHNYKESNTKLEEIAPIRTEKDELKEYSQVNVISAVGSPLVKKRLIELWPYKNYINFVHSTSWLAQGVELGSGVTIAPMCVVNTNVSISDHVLINIGSTISHDTVISDYVTLCPKVSIAGKVKLGEGIFLGIGSNVIDDIHIASGVIVAAGATVTTNIEKNMMVAGVPAIKKKSLSEWYK